MVRKYSLTRSQVPGFLPILKEMQCIMEKRRVNVLGLIPPLIGNMSCLHVTYQFESLDHRGEVLDDYKNSEEVNDLIIRKNLIVRLETYLLMTPLDE